MEVGGLYVDIYEDADIYLKLQDRTVMRIDDFGYCQVFDNDLLPFSLRDKVKTVFADSNLSRKDENRITWDNIELFDRFALFRITPISRGDAKSIYNNLDIPQKLSGKGAIRMLLMGCGLSASDDYWLTTDINEKWSDVSLRSNSLDQRVSEMAMSGVYPDQDRWIEKEKRRHLITPELTAQGSSEKVWLQENGKLALYKTSKYHGENPLVSIKEAMVSDILDCTNVPHVHYDLVARNYAFQGKSIALTRCEAINNNEYSLVDAMEIAMSRKIPTDELTFAKMVDSDLFYKTIVVDYLVSNPDRHPCNWGFFMNNKTGEIVGMHPLLDFEKAFDEKCMKDATDIECRMMPDTSMKDAAQIAIQRCDFRCTKPITRDMFFTDSMYKSFMSRAEELGLYRQQEQKRKQKHEQKRERKSLIKRLMNRDKSQGEQMPSIVVKDNTHEYWQWITQNVIHEIKKAKKEGGKYGGWYGRQEEPFIERFSSKGKLPDVYVPITIKSDNVNEYWQRVNRTLNDQNLAAYKKERAMEQSREVVIRRMEGGRILLDQFIKSTAEKRDAMGLDNSAVAACREIIGNNKAMAVVRRDMIDAYLESIGKGGFNIMDYVKGKAAAFENSKSKCRPHKRQEEVELAVGM